MKEFWMKLKEWWSNLALREKQAVSIGGSLLVIFIIYFWMWTPYINHVASMREKITSDEKTLVWMQAADKAMQKAEDKTGAKTKSLSPVALLGEMQKQVKLSGLEGALTQLKQGANESIELHFQKVEFDKLIKLLAKAMKEKHVSVSHLSLISIEPGLVSATIVMKQ